MNEGENMSVEQELRKIVDLLWGISQKLDELSPIVAIEGLREAFGFTLEMVQGQTERLEAEAARCTELNPNGGTATCIQDVGHVGPHMNRGGTWQKESSG